MTRTASDDRTLALAFGDLPGAVVVLDADGRRVLASNRAADALLGPGAAALLDVGAEPVAARAREALAAAIAGDGPAPAELVTGAGRTWRVRARRLREDGAAAVGALVTLDDVTDEVRARETAERIARAGEDMLSIVSHDLRGPLSSIHVAADGLRELDLGPTDRVRYLDAIQRSVQKADRLIRDLMDARNIEAGKLTVEPRPVRVRELLEQAARDHETVASQAGATVTVQVADGLDRIDADRDRVLQCLAHLIQNALRHGRPAREVELSAAATPAGVELAVRDHGPGIPAEALPTLFDRHAAGRRRNGPGLGLPIVRGIVTAHGGRVTAGAADGGGARVVMVLPRRGA